VKDPLAESTLRARRIALVTLLILAGIVVWAVLQPAVVGTVAILFSIILMIMLHEFGHFVMAKRGGMKVTEFFIGFGPRLWSFRRGETEYGVKAFFLLGGYVRIIGMHNLEEVAPEDEPRAYRSRPFRDRLGVAVAGSAMHFLIALVLIFVLLAAYGDPRTAEALPIVGSVLDGSPAQAAGLQEGDRIVAVDGTPIEVWQDVPDLVEPRFGDDIVVTVDRDGEQLDLAITPEAVERDGETVGRVGVANSGDITPYERVSLPSAFTDSFVLFSNGARNSVDGLGTVFSPSGLSRYWEALTNEGQDETGEQVNERFVSPVEFPRLAGFAVEEGGAAVLQLLIAINIFIGIFNLIPLLPFDGGHVSIAVYEKVASTIRRRPVHADVAKLLPVTSAVILVLGFILITSIYLGIVSPLQNPF